MAVTITQEGSDEIKTIGLEEIAFPDGPHPLKKPTSKDMSVDRFYIYGRKRMNSRDIAAMEFATVSQVAQWRRLPHLKQAYERGMAHTKYLIRDKQLEVALQGNVPMLIHVGKYFADQEGSYDDDHISEAFQQGNQHTWDGGFEEELRNLSTKFLKSD